MLQPVNTFSGNPLLQVGAFSMGSDFQTAKWKAGDCSDHHEKCQVRLCLCLVVREVLEAGRRHIWVGRTILEGTQ